MRPHIVAEWPVTSESRPTAGITTRAAASCFTTESQSGKAHPLSPGDLPQANAKPTLSAEADKGNEQQVRALSLPLFK
jgi:hypothetical protein